MSFSSRSAKLTILALLSASTLYCFYKSRRLRKLKLSLNPTLSSRKPKLFFISQTGTSKALAHRLLNVLNSNGLVFDLVDPKDYEPEDLFKETLVLFVASTWEDGGPPPHAKFLANWLSESAEDFRVGSLLLSQCKFSVFGVGSRVYGETYNAVARDFSKRMKALGAKEILPIGEGDVDGGDIDKCFDDWSRKLLKVVKVDAEGNGVELCSGIAGDSDAVSVEEEYEEEDDDLGEEDIVDLEDIAGKGPSRKSTNVVETNGKLNGKKVMVTPVIRASLEKQVSSLAVYMHIFNHKYGSTHLRFPNCSNNCFFKAILSVL